MTLLIEHYRAKQHKRDRERERANKDWMRNANLSFEQSDSALTL